MVLNVGNSKNEFFQISFTDERGNQITDNTRLIVSFDIEWEASWGNSTATGITGGNPVIFQVKDSDRVNQEFETLIESELSDLITQDVLEGLSNATGLSPDQLDSSPEDISLESVQIRNLVFDIL